MPEADKSATKTDLGEKTIAGVKVYGARIEKIIPVGANGNDNAAVNVFTRRDGTIRHFWSEEMCPVPADPGQDPRGAPDLMPLWTILDMTPEGRARDWYPKLAYGNA